MKHIIILFFAFITSLSAYSQASNIEEGNLCFDKGDYTCAEAKYKAVFKAAVGKDKQIAEIKIQRAKRCIENLINADLEFKNKNYSKSKELYLAILDSNPNDEIAKSQLEIIIAIIKKASEISLNISNTDISFMPSGGKENIYITTNSKTYTIDLLPNWCKVQKFENYFVISCSNNYQNDLRSDYFTVKAGDKAIRINIKQEGSPKVKENKIEVSRSNLFFPYDGNSSETIYITTNSEYFDFSLVPSWCKVTKFNNYITVSCEKNESNQTRNDWFKISINNKEVKIYVSQSENTKQNKTSGSTPITNKRMNSFSSIGIQSGQIAKYGILYETGGKNFIGFHMSLRTSNTPEEEILNGENVPNKNEFVFGPNFKLNPNLFINIGIGYGFYNSHERNDYAGISKITKNNYMVTPITLMIRLNRVISINGGASFMEIGKAFYKPEYIFGISFNLKSKYKS
jgi:hypothetical protein